MMLPALFQPESSTPLERGISFPQYWDNGDRVTWWNPMDFSYRFWDHLVTEAYELPKSGRDIAVETLLMGGEL